MGFKKWNRKSQFSDRHCTFPMTEFQQTAANFQQQKIRGTPLSISIFLPNPKFCTSTQKFSDSKENFRQFSDREKFRVDNCPTASEN